MDNVSFPTPNLYAAPQRNAMRTMIIIACVLVGLLLGLLTLLLIGLGTGFVPTLFGFVLATLPVPIYVALALWIDRFEPEQRLGSCAVRGHFALVWRGPR